MEEYVRSLADFAQRRLGTDLGLRVSDEEIDPQVGLTGSDGELDSGGGWGPPHLGLVQEQVGGVRSDGRRGWVARNGI